MPIDIILLAAFAYGFWTGYNQGIIGTVFNIGAYLFGITLAFKVTPVTTNILETMFHSNNPAMPVAAFIVNLIFVMFIMRMVAKAMEATAQTLFLGVLNRASGGILMGVIGVVIYSVVLWFAVKTGFVNAATIAESRSYPHLETLPSKAKNVLMRGKPLAQDLWGSSQEWMDRLSKYGAEKTAQPAKPYKIPDNGRAIDEDPYAPTAPTTTQPVRPTQGPPVDDDGIEE